MLLFPGLFEQGGVVRSIVGVTASYLELSSAALGTSLFNLFRDGDHGSEAVPPAVIVAFGEVDPGRSISSYDPGPFGFGFPIILLNYFRPSQDWTRVIGVEVGVSKAIVVIISCEAHLYSFFNWRLRAFPKHV